MRFSRSKFCVFSLWLLCFLSFVLCGCGKKVDPLTFTETVNGIDWTVEYDGKTKKVISIAARNGMVFGSPEYYSPFYLFMQDFKGESCTVIHTITLSGVPLKNNLFRITQTDEYSTSGDEADFKKVREYFPSCTYNKSSHEMSGFITFCELSTKFDMKIVFEKMPS